MNKMLAIIPGDLTSQLQPLDVNINKPFKNNMHNEWMTMMGEGRHEMTIWEVEAPINNSV